MNTERRNLSRRDFSYYMKVMNENTGKLIGHLSDISTSGFKVDSSQPVPLNTDLQLRIDEIGDISTKRFLVFKARAMWCRQDPFDPNLYNIGFKIVNMTPVDHDIFLKMFNMYGSQRSSH